MHEIIFIVPGPINQVVSPCSSAHNPKRFESTKDPKRGDQRGISHKTTAFYYSIKEFVQNAIESFGNPLAVCKCYY